MAGPPSGPPLNSKPRQKSLMYSPITKGWGSKTGSLPILSRSALMFSIKKKRVLNEAWC